MFGHSHSCISECKQYTQYMPVWGGGGGGGGGCIPGELHLLLMQPPVSNAYDNISYDGLGEIGGEGGGGGLVEKIPKL